MAARRLLKRWLILSLVGLSGVIAWAVWSGLKAHSNAHSQTALTCPIGTSEQVFGDVRDLCATRANEIAESLDGHVTYLNNNLDAGCTVLPKPEVHPADEESIRPCDDVTSGGFSQYYPFNSTRLNFPGNEDYRADLPIGILVIAEGANP
jgi:hypothetical protein